MKKLSVLTLSCCLLLAGCNNAPKEQVEEKSLPEVKIEVAKLQPFEQTVEFTSTIEAFVKNMISSQTAMRIEKIMVEVGDPVKTGQLLVKMEETNYLQAKIQLENLKVDYARVEALYNSGGASKQQLDQLKTQLDVTKESIDNLEKNTQLLSPISGVITARYFDNGDLTGGQPILQVQQLNPVKIFINVSEEYFPQVKTGMSVDIRLDIYPDEVFRGKISLIYPTVDPVTHTFVTEIRIENTNAKIRPGMFARTTLSFGEKDRVVISDLAVVKQPGTNDRYVYVVNNDNTVSYKKIELGKRKGNVYEIISGISEGEKLVVAGISRLVDGTSVTVVQE